MKIFSALLESDRLNIYTLRSGITIRFDDMIWESTDLHLKYG